MNLFLKILITVFTQIGMANSSYIANFKLQNGVFKYSSPELSGTSMATASPSLNIYKFLNEENQIGICFDLFFNTITKTVSLYGIGMSYKYNLYGTAGIQTNSNDDISIKSYTKWNIYFLSNLKKYTYYLGSNKSDETRFDQNGDFFNFDIGSGVGFDMGNHLKFTSDFSITLLSFASSDNRVKFSSLLVALGIQKEFF